MIFNQKNMEELFKWDLYQYLLSKNRVDEHLPEAPDLESLWSKIGESYLPDAMREFNKYPTVALGWIMFVGMALAKYWDTDWELYSKVDISTNIFETASTSTTWMTISVRKSYVWTKGSTKPPMHLWQNVPLVHSLFWFTKDWNPEPKLLFVVLLQPCIKCT